MENEFVLERGLATDDGTFGTIKVGDRIFHTAELPECIPAGTYTVLARRSSKKFDYAHYSIQDAKGREVV